MKVDLAWTRSGLAKSAIAISLALGGGIGTFAVAHAATPAPSTGASPSTSPGSSGSTQNCPNM